ncbi:hypothetical protein UU5_04459 [Rhodanobacter sp. 115]|nr:hypothetical protein UU5_04459 [Rhodanobacter sp. 115]
MHDRHVGIEEALPHRLGEIEAACEAAFVEIVVEQAADATRLAAMLEVEILVAPALVARIDIRAERRAQVARHRMPVHHVFVERIERGEIEAATEPPHRLHSRLARLEIAHVGVRGGHVGVLRVQHQRHAGGNETAADQVRAMRGGAGRQLVAVHTREIHPGLLEQRPIAQHAGASAAAGRTGPGVFDEAGLAVELFHGGADAILQFAQEGFGLVGLQATGRLCGRIHRRQLSKRLPACRCGAPSRRLDDDQARMNARATFAAIV